MIKNLAYFFESYYFPASKVYYPTKEKLWDFTLQTEGEDIKVEICKNIEWVLGQDTDEQKDVLRYINQLTYMGPIHFGTLEEMLVYLRIMLTYFRENS